MSLCVCKGDVFLLLLYQNSLDFASCWLGCPNFKLQKKKEIPEGISLTYTTHTKYWIFVVNTDSGVTFFVTVML